MLRDGRRCGAKRFYIAGDFNNELKLLCTSNEEDEELCGMYGPHCWQKYGTDTGSISKLMWYSTMKEFHCKAISTWLSCDERTEMAFTHKQWGKNGRTLQLDCKLGSKADSSVTYTGSSASPGHPKFRALFFPCVLGIQILFFLGIIV